MEVSDMYDVSSVRKYAKKNHSKEKVMNRYDTPLEDAVRRMNAEQRATIHELREDLADAHSEIEALEEQRKTAVEALEVAKIIFAENEEWLCLGTEEILAQAQVATALKEIKGGE